MTDLEIRKSIAGYIAGEMEAAQLEDLLETEAWELDEPGTPLVSDALRLLAEFANGDWSEEELRAHLGALSRTYWFHRAPKMAWSGSQSITRREQLVAAGTPHEAECA